MPLVACAGQPAARVGRKAARLGWAEAHGLRTPGGVVVPAERLRAALEACGASARARYLVEAALRLDPRHALDVAASVAASLAAPAVEDLAREAAAAAFAAVGAPVVACRSSAAMEDGRRAAFPGVFRSVLGVRSPDALAGAVAACWRSAYSAGAVRYLLRLGIEPADLSLAVLVQRQVVARWSGVYVGSDPRTGSGPPLADVSDAGPDALTGGARPTVRARREAGGWAGAGAPALAAALEAVHEMAAALAGRAGLPAAGLEVEFAVPDDAGGPVLLQCRPLTGAGAERADADGGSRDGGGGGRPGPDAGGPVLVGRPCAGGRAVGPAVDAGAMAAADAGGGGEAGSGPVVVVERAGAVDPGLVFACSGLVAEHDASPLSHLAALCRELGVPFVCGVDGARARLPGRRVAVDGSTGTVRVVTRAGPEVGAGTVVGAGTEAAAGTAAVAAIGAVELVLRVLAEGRPGRPALAEAERLARCGAAALGAEALVVRAQPLDEATLAVLDELGAERFGAGFSAAALLADLAGG